MAPQYSAKTAKVGRRIIHDMFQVKAGEVVAITADTGTDDNLIQSLFDATAEVDGKPLVMKVRQARDNGQAGLPDWPAETLTAALSTVDVWIETNAAFMLYSDIFEGAMGHNKQLRFTTITGASVDSLDRIFCDYEIPLLGKILKNIKSLAQKTHTVQVTSTRGTDVCFEMEPKHIIDYDDGDFSQPKFCTAPGYVNLVPRSGTMQGRIVFDMIMHVDLSKGGHVEFEMNQGRITDFHGAESAALSHYIAKFNEDNMSKISHMMIGLCPGVRELSWEIVEDERLWGGVDFGFGHTSPLDMPPLGQPASSHFDGVLAKTCVYFDDQAIIENGIPVHPLIAGDARQLLQQYAQTRQTRASFEG